MQTKEQVIEDFLILNGPSTQSEISEASGISQSQCSRVLQSMATAGSIKVYSFDQKLYSSKRKPTTAQALMRTQLCAIARISSAYTIMLGKLGQHETDTKFIEAIRHEMMRWSEVINELEDRYNREV